MIIKKQLFTGGYLTKDEIEEFQKLVKEIMGIDLTYGEAEDQGSRLIMTFEALQKVEPIPMSYKDVIDQK